VNSSQDAASVSQKHIFTPHTQRVMSCVITNDNAFCISVAYDSLAMVFDLKKGTLVQTFRGHNKPIRAVCIAPGSRACTGGKDFFAKVWEYETGKEIFSLAHRNIIVSMAASSSNYLVTSCIDSQTRIFSLTDGSLLRTFQGHVKWTNKIVLQDNLIYTASDDATARVFDMSHGDLYRIAVICEAADPRLGRRSPLRSLPSDMYKIVSKLLVHRIASNF